MKFLAAFGLLGFVLSMSLAVMQAPSAGPTRWERVPHAPLFKTVAFTGKTAVTTSPDVVVGIRGTDPFPGFPGRCCNQVADAIAY